MTRTLLLSVTAILVSGLPSWAAAPDRSTVWKGTLDAGGKKLRLELAVSRVDGKLTGHLRSLDQGNIKLAATMVQLDGKELRFSIPKVGASFRGKLNKEGTVCRGTFRQGGAALPLSFAKVSKKEAVAKKYTLKEAWIGKLSIGFMKPVMQFRIVTSDTGQTMAFFDSVTEGKTGFAARWSIKGDTLQFDVPKIKLQYRGKLNKERDSAVGTWRQAGRRLPLTLKKHAQEYDNVNVWENRPQRPKGPFPYDALEVKFPNKRDGLTLAGTLTIPKGPGRHPVVVLISGSGPQDRDETIVNHKPFLVLADYLSRRGIAVLRYDDRGTAASTGDFGTASTKDFAYDASAAVSFLKGHSRIDPARIGLAGHSEGGLIAPLVVGMRDDVAFVVLLAATGVDGATISHSQVKALLAAGGAGEAEIKTALAVNRELLNVVAKAKPDADVTQALEKAIERVLETIPESDRKEAGKNIRQAVSAQSKRLRGKWMRFFVSYDPRPALTNMKCPVLVLIGSKDLQVLPDLNLPEIRKALIKGGNKDFEIVKLKGLNHLFQECQTGAMSEYASIQETFNPRALAVIGDWISKRTKPKRQDPGKRTTGSPGFTHR